MGLGAGRRSAAAWLALAIFGVGATDGCAATLSDALITAYGENAQLNAARAELRAVDEQVPQALAQNRINAQFTGSKGLSDQRTREILTLARPHYAGRPESLVLSVTQPIWRGGRAVYETDAAEKQVFAARAGLVNAEQTVFNTVITDYVNVQAEETILRLTLDNEAVLRRQLAATKDQFDRGAATRTDLSQATAALSQALASRLNAEGQLGAYRAAFKHDVGEEPESLTPPGDLPPLPATRDEAVSEAIENAPTVLQAKFTLDSAAASIEVERRALLPTFSLEAQVARSTEAQTIRSRTDTAQITGNVSVPIFDGGTTYSRARAAVATRGQRQKQLDDARNAAEQAAIEAWDLLDATRATVVAQNDQVKANENAFAGIRQEQGFGTRTIYDVLNQENLLFQSRVNLVQSQRQTVIYHAALLRAVGRLTAETMNLPVELYDPTRNYDIVHHEWIGFRTAE